MYNLLRLCLLVETPAQTAAPVETKFRRFRRGGDPEQEFLSWQVPPDYDYTKSTMEVHATFDNTDSKAVDSNCHGEFASIRKDRDIKYHGTYSKERQTYQDVLIRNVVRSASIKSAPWIVFTAGAMGAGKGYTVDWMFNQGIFPINDFISIDPDHFKHELPEWTGYVKSNSMEAGGKCHRESGYLVEIAQDYALSTGKNVWVDGKIACYNINVGTSTNFCVDIAR